MPQVDRPARISGLVKETIASIGDDISVILVTHNVFQSRRIASRVALMLQGRITEVSSGATFFDHPEDERTAAFLRGELVYEPTRACAAAGRGRRTRKNCR